MRFISARFKGLQGLYRNSMQKEVFIDFTKSIHNIIYIVGPNGSGKSTLMTALNPLPDSPSMYIDGELGEKELVYENNGTIYNILIQYPVYANGSRAATKAFFKEITDNSIVELNSNGTVGSFKDIVYSRFNLDPNFVSLSYLSVEDRGIVEKKPSERKKFVANLLEALEVYNDIYKTLVKRSSVFKSMINSISAKIDSIGDPEKLIMDKTSMENRIAFLEKQKESIEGVIASSRATISLLDPNNTIRNTYNSLIDSYNIVKGNIDVLQSKVSSFDIKDIDEATSLYLEYKQDLVSVKREIDFINTRLQETLLSRDEESRLVFIKTQKYQSIIKDIRGDLERTIVQYRKRIFEYEQTFKQLNIIPGSITKDEYIIGLNTLDTLRTSILNVRSYATEKSIQDACSCLKGERSLIDELNTIQSEKDKLETKIRQYKDELQYNMGLLKRTEILVNRPEACIINECAFIREALDAKAENPEKKIAILNRDINNIVDQLSCITDIITSIQLALRVYNDLNIALRSFLSNKSILDKLPIDKKYLDIRYLSEAISIGDPMNDIFSLYDYIDKANIFELYKNDYDILTTLESEQKISTAQKEIADQLQSELTELQKKLTNIDDTISEGQNLIKDYNKKTVDLEEKISDIDSAITVFRSIEKYNEEKKEIESKLKTVSTNIDTISKEVNNINKNTTLLQSVVSELNPLRQSKDSINYSLAKLQEYQQELNEYNSKYSIIELLKKYSSPTKGGIQTIFMQLYMDKTLSLSNQLLDLIFGGKLELLPYIINENEFRIPTKSNVTNLIVDDVSNCSTSEKSMIAMTMSFALAFHSSPLYNIVRLDEIDGGLDQDNRSMFPIVCRRMVEMLNIEQCFVISHSSESDLSDIDIISLYPDSWRANGNIIFSL